MVENTVRENKAKFKGKIQQFDIKGEFSGHQENR